MDLGLFMLVRYLCKLLIQACLLVLELLMVILEFGEYLKTLLIVPLQLFVVAFHLLVILQSHIELVIQGRETVLFHIVLLLLLL